LIPRTGLFSAKKSVPFINLSLQYFSSHVRLAILLFIIKKSNHRSGIYPKMFLATPLP